MEESLVYRDEHTLGVLGSVVYTQEPECLSSNKWKRKRLAHMPHEHIYSI